MIRVYIGLILWLPFYIIMGITLYIMTKIDQIFKTNLIVSKREKIYRVFAKLARSYIYLAGVKVDATKLEGLQDIPSVIVANHQSNIDPWLIYGLLPVKQLTVVAKKTISNVPLMKTYGKVLGGYYIDRDNPKQALRVLKEASSSISDGIPFVIFPEGTRSKSDNLGEIKAGYTMPVKTHKVPIQVVRETGGYRSLEGRKLFQFRAHVKFEYVGKIEYENIDFKTIDSKIAQMLGE
jgi:1-acyl-sn-glycerol-3-phosphate acyltransferase